MNKIFIKKTNGITLIALVITIIIMLILAGVGLKLMDGSLFFKDIADKAEIYTESAWNEKNVIDSYMDFLNNDVSNTEFPLKEEGRYYITINAGGYSQWKTAIFKGITVPNGALLNLSVQTSNNKKDWSSEYKLNYDFTTANSFDLISFDLTEKIEKTQYMRVVFDLISNDNGESPELNSSRVILIPLYALEVKINDVIVPEPDENEEITLQPNETAEFIMALGRMVPIENLQVIANGGSFTGFGVESGSGSGSETGGGAGSGAGGGTGNGLGSSISVSSDGQNWSPASGFSGSVSYIKVVTTNNSISPASVSTPSIAVSSVPSGEGEISQVKWTTIKNRIYEVDASQVVNWVSIEKAEEVLENTRILYQIYSSNDDITYEYHGENIEDVPNSRYIRVIATLQRKGSKTTIKPKITELMINYILVGASPDSTPIKIKADCVNDPEAEPESEAINDFIVNVTSESLNTIAVDTNNVTTIDGSEIVNIIYKLDGIEYSNTNQRTFVFENLQPDTTYEISITAVDSQGKTKTTTISHATWDKQYIVKNGVINPNLVFNNNVTKTQHDGYVTIYTGATSARVHFYLNMDLSRYTKSVVDFEVTSISSSTQFWFWNPSSINNAFAGTNVKYEGVTSVARKNFEINITPANRYLSLSKNSTHDVTSATFNIYNWWLEE